MKNTLTETEKIIEPEIIDENGCPIETDDHMKDAARPKGDTGGLIGGFFVLAFGFIMTLLVAVFTIFIVVPLMLLGRLFGMQVKSFRQ